MFSSIGFNQTSLFACERQMLTCLIETSRTNLSTHLQCRKKHSYICPEFEASGSCPQGLKCKLYHPKKGKAKRRKVLRDQKNAKGRYFGTGLSVVADPEARPVVLEKHAEPNKVSVVFQGELGDFVSLDVSDDEAQEDGQSIEQTFLSEDGLLNSQLDDLDYLIKPLGILGRL